MSKVNFKLFFKLKEFYNKYLRNLGEFKMEISCYSNLHSYIATSHINTEYNDNLVILTDDGLPDTDIYNFQCNPSIYLNLNILKNVYSYSISLKLIQSGYIKSINNFELVEDSSVKDLIDKLPSCGTQAESPIWKIYSEGKYDLNEDDKYTYPSFDEEAEDELDPEEEYNDDEGKDEDRKFELDYPFYVELIEEKEKEKRRKERRKENKSRYDYDSYDSFDSDPADTDYEDPSDTEQYFKREKRQQHRRERKEDKKSGVPADLQWKYEKERIEDRRRRREETHKQKYLKYKNKYIQLKLKLKK